jgi:hypothetical protein
MYNIFAPVYKPFVQIFRHELWPAIGAKVFRHSLHGCRTIWEKGNLFRAFAFALHLIFFYKWPGENHKPAYKYLSCLDECIGDFITIVLQPNSP